MPSKPSTGEPIIVSVSALKGKDNPGYVEHNEQNRRRQYLNQHYANNNNISIIAGATINGDLKQRNNSSFHKDDFSFPNDLQEIRPQSSPTNNPAGRTNGAAFLPTDSNAVAEAQTSDVQMKKSITLAKMVAIMVAVTGHVSIFVSPAAILRETGSVGGALVVWLVGGLINLGTALCFAELGTMFPSAGGPYAYASRAFGPLVGFLMMWGYTVLLAGPFWAYLANTAALYTVTPIYGACIITAGGPEEVDTAVNLLAGWIMITMVVLNCVYMKYVTRVQTILSASKVLALLIIVGAGLYNIATGHTENLQAPFESTTREPGKVALAIFYSVFSYGGWQVMTTMLEEVKDTARDPPRSVYITFAVVITKYILANVAYFTILSPGEVVGSRAVSFLFTQRMYQPLSLVISALVALTCIGALNASIMGNTRLLYAGARQGHMPQILGMVHVHYLTPWPSIFVYTMWGLVMLFTGGVQDMMDFIGLFSTIMSVVVMAALIYFRVTEPQTPRPYRTMTFIPAVSLVVNLTVLALCIYQKPHKMGMGLAILAAGMPVYWLGVTWERKPTEFTDIVDRLTSAAQKLLMVTKVNK